MPQAPSEGAEGFHNGEAGVGEVRAIVVEIFDTTLERTKPLAPGNLILLEISRERGEIGAQHDVAETELSRPYWRGGLADEVEIVNIAGFNSGIAGRVAGAAEARVHLDQAKRAVTNVPFEFNLAETDVADVQEEFVAGLVNLVVDDRLDQSGTAIEQRVGAQLLHDAEAEALAPTAHRRKDSSIWRSLDRLFPPGRRRSVPDA